MTIQVIIKSTYGLDRIYPYCDKAKAFTKMLGQDSLTKRDIEFIKLLGYTVEVVTAFPKTL